MKYTIAVTQEHIDEGLTACPRCLKCPVALALNGRFPDEIWSVGNYYARSQTRWFEVPRQARSFIYQLDGGIVALQPFSFTCDIHDEQRPCSRPEPAGSKSSA